ncbi:hypothetical protein [Pseudonocardia alni]|uniref:Uncharacterized protein n=1 Tax=Pseudonocardia alni TaxID=33907 RepID=A0AA44UQX4_PSEA5|nr:hypothetical protein [Pseudonocardia alni]PKB31610.1 hypothetical protein ATL51_3304 [Pseudonocardia alni]
MASGTISGGRASSIVTTTCPEAPSGPASGDACATTRCPERVRSRVRGSCTRCPYRDDDTRRRPATLNRRVDPEGVFGGPVRA